MYETIVTKLQIFKHHIISGTDQNFDFIKINQHKNIVDLLDTFLSNNNNNNYLFRTKKVQ